MNKINWKDFLNKKIQKGDYVKLIGSKGGCSISNKKCIECFGEGAILKIRSVSNSFIRPVEAELVEDNPMNTKGSMCNFEKDDLIKITKPNKKGD